MGITSNLSGSKGKKEHFMFYELLSSDNDIYKYQATFLIMQRITIC